MKAESDAGWLVRNYRPGWVSVVVPAFNNETTLQETLQSVFVQTYRPIELVIIDDGSDDSTLTVAQEFAKRASQDASFAARVVRQPNGGAPNARNNGAQHSSGEFLLFLDADDTLHPEKIARQAAALKEHGDWDFSYGPIALLEEPRRSVWGNRAIDWHEAAIKQISSTFFTTMGPLLRRDFVKRLGPWDGRFACCQDWEFHIRMIYLKPKFGFVPGALAFYRGGERANERVSSRSTGRHATARGFLARRLLMRTIIRGAPPEIACTKEFRTATAYALLDLSATEALFDREEPARKNLAKAVRTTPSPIARALYLSYWRALHTLGPRAFGHLHMFLKWLYWKGVALKKHHYNQIASVGQ